MKNEESEFSSLKTVSSFDPGGAQTLAVGVSSQDLQQFSAASLLVESLIEQICCLMEKNPSDQRRLYLSVCKKLRQMNLIGESYEREEFQFMRSHYQKALYQLLTIAKTTSVGNGTLLPNTKSLMAPSNSTSHVEWSRYRTEFHEIEYIAKGGFGHVYKSQHKLDGEMYAIKKIFLRYTSVGDFLRNLREVKMLAKLNHPHIVAYKAAWLEASEEHINKIAITDVSSTNSLSSKSDTQSENSLEVVFESSEKSTTTKSEKVNIAEYSEATSSSCSIEYTGKICKYAGNSKCSVEYFDEVTRQSAVLFIQMQLCDKTLRQWLDFRNLEMQPADAKTTMAIFIQVVRGVEYIHSQGLVHHDIKPSNIFVNQDLSTVQVGDFGLACCLLTHPQSSLSVISTHQPGLLGTKLYAAPEQLRGDCNAKSDVYSLGIVLFELIQPFNTAMERSKVISQLRDGHIPPELRANHSSIAMLISQTVTSLRKRPTSSELLEILMDAQNQKANEVVEEQNRTIKLLQQESIAKDVEIADLKQQLEQLSKQLESI